MVSSLTWTSVLQLLLSCMLVKVKLRSGIIRANATSKTAMYGLSKESVMSKKPSVANDSMTNRNASLQLATPQVAARPVFDRHVGHEIVINASNTSFVLGVPNGNRASLVAIVGVKVIRVIPLV